MRSSKSLHIQSLICALLASSAIYAQAPADSTPVFGMDTVRVVDHRSLLSDYDIAGSISRIQVSRTDKSNKIADLLNGQSGVFIKSYGGGEGLQSISLRGGGSRACPLSARWYSLNQYATWIG